ncbi:YbdD/YjiX family protein [Nocardia rhamnosiphila]|uniref:YbdD/YjiX family protein n=1 Tax=Nocardia rhamnosiphila TaxID=426716 RepID=UPI0005682241|nr:YbdD/YjiX family protein [Nocardia rhamnosiphila]
MTGRLAAVPGMRAGAVGAERSGLRGVPAPPARGARALARGVRAVFRYLDSVVGGQDYQRYLAHMRRVHPGRPVMSERDYWRERYADAERNPGARCC